VAIGALAYKGITSIVATRHFNDQYPHVSTGMVHERVGELQRVFMAGHEVYLDFDTEGTGA
jgi:hypothetical protein